MSHLNYLYKRYIVILEQTHKLCKHLVFDDSSYKQVSRELMGGNQLVYHKF